MTFSISITAKKNMKFSIKDFFSKCDQTTGNYGLVTFTEEILKGKLHFLCSDIDSELTHFVSIFSFNSTRPEPANLHKTKKNGSSF